MCGAAEFCINVWQEIPCIVVAAPIAPMQARPTGNHGVATNPAVASANNIPHPTAIRVRPDMRPRIATRKPPAIAAQPIVLASIARPLAPRPKIKET